MRAILTILAICSMLFLSAKAQISMSYSIGSFGNIGSHSTVYSGPFIVTGNSCLVVSNGVTKYLPGKRGVFLTNCVVAKEYIRFSIKIFPNPVVSVLTIQSADRLQISNDFKLEIYSVGGHFLKYYKLNQDQLLYGFKVDMGGFPAGIYLLHLSSTRVSETFKIIKAQ